MTRRIATFAADPERGPSARLAGHLRQLALTPADAAARRLRDAVSVELAGGGVDAVVLTGKRTFPVLDAVGDTPLVVDLCDATSSRLCAEARHAGPLRAADLALQHLSVRRIERALIRRSQQLLVASERDRDLLVDTSGRPDAPSVARAEVIPNGVDLDYWHRTSDPGRRHRVLRQPRLRAQRRCGPPARARRHAARLGAPARCRGRDRRANPCTGGATRALDHRTSPSPAPCPTSGRTSSEAAVFAAPLRVASGIQNKLLEALAMELPVVTTPVAAAGLRTAAGPPLEVADLPADLAAPSSTASNRAAADPSPIGSRAWVAERFSWDRSGRHSAPSDGPPAGACAC